MFQNYGSVLLVRFKKNEHATRGIECCPLKFNFNLNSSLLLRQRLKLFFIWFVFIEKLGILIFKAWSEFMEFHSNIEYTKVKRRNWFLHFKHKNFVSWIPWNSFYFSVFRYLLSYSKIWNNHKLNGLYRVYLRCLLRSKSFDFILQYCQKLVSSGKVIKRITLP